MVNPRRLLALGGIGGPLAFVTAWATLGARTKNYAPTHDAISQLAAVGAPTRAEMTGGFVAFAVGVSLYALAAREQLSPRVAAAAAANGVFTLGVAALPLEGFGGSAGHAAAAAAAYASLATLPTVGASAFSEDGHVTAARLSRLAALAIAVALVLSIVSPTRTGLFQRLGLSLGDVWIVATSIWMLRGQSLSDGRGASPAAR
ncbi:MAG TPA: DUF998 domain-containing protein [Acidimicrobiales bacterium]|nr:DUF998 domain-containing protein [Acidimicrobiales bacterium]